ncbi:MAG TPA: sulfotransferase [Blastocatellia bacterium]|nr:sulfotransferase [Blastocatellia bacterium]
MSRDFFIIFGCPRSGTTLLSQCLTAHSRIHVPYETDILGPCAFIVDRVKNPGVGKEIIVNLITHSYYFDVSLGHYLTPQDIRDVVKGAKYDMQAIFMNLYSLLGARARKSIIGDKSPFDILDAFILARTGLLNEPMKVIHIVRDIRDVMVSLNRQGWFPNADSYFPRLWSQRNLFLQAHMEHASNYFLLRYEDFVREPAKWLNALCAFVGAELEEQMPDTFSFPAFYKTMPAHSRLHSPIGPQYIGEWKSQATSEQVQNYESQAREALLKFGYLDSDGTPGVPK